MQHLFKQLTDVFRSLDPPLDPGFLPPALDEDITAAEAQLELSFPNDLRELLLCANGQNFPDKMPTPIFPAIRFTSEDMGKTSSTWLNGVNAIVENTGYHREDYEDLKDDGPFEILGPAFYHDQVIAFTATENSDSLVIDLLPGPGGKIGQVTMVCTQPYQIAVLAPDLRSFVNMALDGYKSGRFKVITDGICPEWADS